MRRQAAGKRAADFDAANLIAARIVLSDVHHHCAALEQWARRVVERLEPAMPQAPAMPDAPLLPTEQDLGELFETETIKDEPTN